MRSSLPSTNGEDDDRESKEEDPFSSFYWWRSITDFDPKASDLCPKVRILKELERLALAAHESFDELRHRLLTYKAGDLWFPAGGLDRNDTDIPPVITILMVGFKGCGKSSVINLMYSVLGRTGILPFAQSSTPAGKDGRTIFLEEHNVLRSKRTGFCIFDSAGLDYGQLNEGLNEVSEWMEEGVRHRQPCRSSGKMIPSSSNYTSSAAKRFARRWVNCVMVVVNMSEIYHSLAKGDLKPLVANRELFHAQSINNNCNDKPVLLLTHGDELAPDARVATRIKLCEFLGISETSAVYDIACHNENGPMLVDEMDPVTAYALSESIYRALLVADRCHPPKRGPKDWLLLTLTWSMWALSSFFSFLADFCSTLAKKEHKLRLL